MVDVSKIIKSELEKAGLKVYNEHFIDSKTEVPCITYRLYDNSSYTEGDLIGYSSIVFYIKVWAKYIKEIEEYSCKVDKIMRALGFKRTNMDSDLWYDNICQRALKYQNLALEEFEQ